MSTMQYDKAYDFTEGIADEPADKKLKTYRVQTAETRIITYVVKAESDDEDHLYSELEDEFIEDFDIENTEIIHTEEVKE